MGAVIYLDVDDEITSAVTRIRAAAPGPVVVVVPYGSRLASSRINFRLLAREAAALQRQLTIVAPEPATRALAASAGLATHATVLEYESVAASQGAAGPAAAAAAGPATPVPEAPMPGARPPAGGGGIRSGGPTRGWSQLSLEETASGGDATQPPAATPGAAQPQPAPAAWAGAGAPPSRPAEPPPVMIIPPGDAAHYLRGPAPAPAIPTVGPARRGPFTATRIAVILVVVALIASAAGAAALALLPSAEITVTPVAEGVGPLALTVTADPAATAPDPARLIVPAIRLSLPVSVTAQFAATGKELIEQKATGAVTFQNCDTGGAHTFPAGAIVKTSDGTAFATAGSVTLARAKINPAFSCTAGTVNVTAVKAGPEANVVAGTISQLPAGYDPIVLSVVNRAATAGGTRTELIRIVRADVDAALAQLRARLAESFAAKLAEPATTPAGSILMTQSQRLGEAAPSTDPNALVGIQQATFELGLSATGTVIAVDPRPVTTVAEARLASSVPAGSGYHLVAGSVRTTVDAPALSGEVVTFAVRVRAERTRDIDANALLAQVRGKSIAAARTVLEPYGTVRISVWPDWVTSIPESEGRVRLVVASTPAAGSSPGPSPAASPSLTGKPAASPSPAATIRPSAAPSPARTVSPTPTAAATKKP